MVTAAPLLLASVLALLLASYMFNRLIVDNNVVRLSHGGDVRGRIMRSEEGRPFYAFRGIPFAEPPLGELRFKAPVTKKPWTGELDATRDGLPCTQEEFFKPGSYHGQEDCLTINVYTPQLPEEGKMNHKRDVAVYIHGGAFLMGSGTSDFVPPERLMDADNVLVAMNYRLDALGFLSTGDEASPGNYGLLDQTLALRWVKDNIEAFGGNPDSVTIFGHSAGGGSVSHHLISPLSKGLFHRAVPASGSALCPWAFEANPLHWAKYMASHTGCPQEPSTDMVKCFRTKTDRELIKGMVLFGNVSSFPIIFTPTLDGHFLQATPYDVFYNQPEMINNVPVLSSITEEEGAGFMTWIKMFKPNITLGSDEYINYVLNSSISGQFGEIMENIKNYYQLTSEEVRTDTENFTRTIIKMLSDGLFKMDHYAEVKALAAAGVPVYAYSYEHALDNFPPIFGEPNKYGVPHGADILMYFDWKLFGKIHLSKRNRKTSKLLMKMVTNFAKTSNPDPTNEFQLGWEPSTPDQFHILKINDSLSMTEYNPNNPDQSFWIDTKLAIQKLKTQ